mmetsp:Transcript_16715/g.27730  ORF Transcript_16715/g.27730 Transcript_16715/m.27730 type:complete len:368 (-) Transcript_16715:44-1147(-)
MYALNLFTKKKKHGQTKLRNAVVMMFWMGVAMVAFDTVDVNVGRRNLTTSEPIFGGVCPAIINEKKGIYADSSKQAGFQDTVLLTASNHQFITFYDNWKFLADGHGLQHVLLSLDQATHDKKDTGNSILLPSNHQVATAGFFRSSSYNTLVCNKIRMVLEILDTCNVNVIFSDSDNVFIKDPFQHDLGDMIKSDKIDYIYQTNGGWTETAREHRCTKEGSFDNEGNTGFHFMKPTAQMKELLQGTLDDCDAEGNEIDDQSLLWGRLKPAVQNGTAWEHCPAYDGVNGTSFEQLGDTTKGRICCLDPHFYPTGQREPKDKDKADLVSLHANFVPVTAAGKIAKLHNFTGGAGWRLPGNIEDHKLAASK